MSAIDDLVSTGKGVVTNLSQLISVLQNVFPRSSGTITLAAGTTNIVSNAAVTSSTIPFFVPTNSAAALLQANAGLYISAATAGVGFSISTQSGTAAGGETFSYVLFIPS